MHDSQVEPGLLAACPQLQHLELVLRCLDPLAAPLCGKVQIIVKSTTGFGGQS
jgi:hypothetical protein